MNNLQRRYFKNDGANKYHIDCAKLEKRHENAIKLLDIINDSSFSILEKPKLVYNPNIY